MLQSTNTRPSRNCLRDPNVVFRNTVMRRKLFNHPRMRLARKLWTDSYHVIEGRTVSVVCAWTEHSGETIGNNSRIIFLSACTFFSHTQFGLSEETTGNNSSLELFSSCVHLLQSYAVCNSTLSKMGCDHRFCNFNFIKACV